MSITISSKCLLPIVSIVYSQVISLVLSYLIASRGCNNLLFIFSFSGRWTGMNICHLYEWKAISHFHVHCRGLAQGRSGEGRW